MGNYYIKTELSFEEWEQLSFEEKRKICNEHWDPFDEKVGRRTKEAILNAFIESLQINYEQVGVACFSHCVYMLFVIVKDSKIRVPTKFSDLIVNKGFVIGVRNNNDVVKVKFKYGGKTDVNISQKIIIK